MTEIFTVLARSGMYEPSYWTVCAYPTRAEAEAEAKRMDAAAEGFWKERQEIGDGPEGDEPEEEFGKLLEEHDAKCRVLLDKWLPIIGDPDLDHYERTEYSAGTIRWRGARPEVAAVDEINPDPKEHAKELARALIEAKIELVSIRPDAKRYQWLFSNGFHAPTIQGDGVITFSMIEDEIDRRIAALPPQ